MARAKRTVRSKNLLCPFNPFMVKNKTNSLSIYQPNGNNYFLVFPPKRISIRKIKNENQE
jgi:hypothetical protein